MLLELNKQTRRKLLKLLQEMVLVTKLDLLALVTKQGVTIALFSDKEVNGPLFAAIAASSAISGAAVTDKMSHGQFQGVTVRGSNGYTILYNVSDFILIGSSAEFISFGLADRVIRKYIQLIPDIFAVEKQQSLDKMITNLKSLL